MPGIQTAAYPTIETYLTLVRVYVNDTFKGATGTAGEGRIYTDDAPWVIPILNASLSDYQRDLDNSGVPTLTKEQVFFEMPPINSPMGQGVPNPAVQQYLSYSGFSDGLLNYNPPALPIDLLAPKKIWERPSNSGLTFTEVGKAAAGIPSLYQSYTLGSWEWRGDSIWWNGATVPKDVRLRYTAQVAYVGDLDPKYFPTTMLPFRESVEALAYLSAEKWCSPRLPPGATAALQQKYQAVIDKIINRQVKDFQNTKYSRAGFGDDGDMFGNW